MGEWQSAEFAQICEHSAFGPRFAGELYATDGNVATLRTTDISVDGRIEYDTMPMARLDLVRFQQHILRVDDLVITRSGRVGTTALFNGFHMPVLPGAFLIRFRLKRDIAEPRFYRYFFNSPVGQELLASVATGSVQQNLNITSVHGLRVPIPPIEEQRAIAHILGTLDDKIELNRRTNETLEAMARAIFKSWFVDFDPVRAKAEGRDPGLPKHIVNLFPDRFEDSELGDIPAGWKTSTLGEIAENPRRTIRPAQIEETTTYIGLEHMPRQSISLADWDSSEGLESNKYDFKRGEILFGKLRPYFHKVGIAPLDGICSTDILVIAAKKPEWFAFVLEHVSSDDFVNYTTATSSGTKMPRTNWKDMSRFSVVTPPSSLAKTFDVLAQPFVERIMENIHEAQTLASLRNALLPRLISGELRVGEASRSIEVGL